MKRKMTDKMMRKLNLSRKAMGNMKKHGGSMMGGVPIKRRDDMMMMQMMQRGGMSPSLEEQVRRRMLNQMASADRSMLEQRMLGVGSGRMQMGGQKTTRNPLSREQMKRMLGASRGDMKRAIMELYNSVPERNIPANVIMDYMNQQGVDAGDVMRQMKMAAAKGQKPMKKRMYGGSMPPMRKSVGLPGGPNEFPLPRKRRM